MESNNERVFSDQGIQEIADALGIDTSALNEPFTGEVDEEGDEVYFDADDVDGTVSGISSGGQVVTSPVIIRPGGVFALSTNELRLVDQVSNISVIWPITIVSTPTIKTAADGSKTVDVVIEFDEIDNATEYRYRIVPV